MLWVYLNRRYDDHGSGFAFVSLANHVSCIQAREEKKGKSFNGKLSLSSEREGQDKRETHTASIEFAYTANKIEWRKKVGSAFQDERQASNGHAHFGEISQGATCQRVPLETY